MLPDVLQLSVLLQEMRLFTVDHDDQLLSPQPSWVAYLKLVLTGVFRLSFIVPIFTLFIPCYQKSLFA